MCQEEKSGEMCKRYRVRKGPEVEPKGTIQLHPMSNRKGETRVVEIYAGSMGRSNMRRVP